jgi:hypothetical protein
LSLAADMPCAFDNYPPDSELRESPRRWPATEDLTR